MRDGRMKKEYDFEKAKRGPVIPSRLKLELQFFQTTTSWRNSGTAQSRPVAATRH